MIWNILIVILYVQLYLSTESSSSPIVSSSSLTICMSRGLSQIPVSSYTTQHCHHCYNNHHLMMTSDHLHPITLILLAEAHVAMPVPLRHAGVVHHEEVHLKTVCASPLYLVVVGANELDHFNTTSFTGGSGGHVGLRISPVPRVMTPRVIPGVAVKTVNCVPGHAVPSSLHSTGDQTCQNKTCSSHHIASPYPVSHLTLRHTHHNSPC